MIDLRQNNVPFIRVGLWHGRSRRERDHNAIDDNAIGTSFACGLAYLGERSLALPSRWHWHWHWLDQLVVIVAVAGSYVAAKRIAPSPRLAGRLNRGGHVCAKLVLAPNDKLMNVIVVEARQPGQRVEVNIAAAPISPAGMWDPKRRAFGGA
jgi:hypothetical protein